MSIFNEYGDIVSVDDVMKMLHIGRTAVYTLLQNGSIRSVKVGRKYIIPKQSVIDFVK
jgi:excisionase family DNA binding protein